jgi:5-methylcytosine-specific restriction endonuclease McrA
MGTAEKARRRVAAWRELNPEKSKASIAEWKMVNRDRARQSVIRWHKANSEKRKGHCAKYRKKHAENIKSGKKKWYIANKDKAVVYSHLRRARKAANGGSFTAEEWEALKRCYVYTCLRCGKVEPEIKLTVDHVVPVALGGPNILGKIQPLCKACNQSKGIKITDYRPS